MMRTAVISIVLVAATGVHVHARPPLSDEQWRRVDASVDRALQWIAGQQREDGSFAAPEPGQPAVTALCVMACLSRGHEPGLGPYGQAIERATEYMLACQRDDGMFTRVPQLGNRHVFLQPSQTAAYNHAITALALCELYGIHGDMPGDRIRNAIDRAMAMTRRLQDRRWVHPESDGGWGYVVIGNQIETDMSITSWQLMFMRSARNAGFDVEANRIDRAVKYITLCFDGRTGSFAYNPVQHDRWTRGMAGAGIFALANAGMHDTDMAQRAGQFLLDRPYVQYRRPPPPSERSWYHYSVLFATIGMYQLGGEYWQRFFPTLVDTLLEHQNADGSWQPETGNTGAMGNVMTTAMVIIALNTPNQLLPIFQR